MIEVSELESFAEEDIWILTETRARALELRWLISQTANPGDKYQVLTRAEAVKELAFRAFKPSQATNRLELLSEQRSQALLLDVALSSKERLPLLSSLLTYDLSTTHGVGLPTRVSELKQFIDWTRLYEAHEVWLRKIIDEFGNALETQRKSEEMVLLADLFDERKRDLGVQDSVSVLEELTQFFAVPEKVIAVSSIPERIILENPTWLFPLERTLWYNLSARLPVTVVTDSSVVSIANELERNTRQRAHLTSLPPAQRFSLSIAEFLHYGKSLSVVAKEPLFPSGEELVRAVIDADSVTDTVNHRGLKVRESVAIWENLEVRDEVRRVALALDHSLKEKLLTPREVHIVLADWDSYAELLSTELANREIPYSMPKGIPLTKTSSAVALRLFLQWWGEPSLESYLNCFSHPLLRIQRPSAKDLESFLTEFSVELEGLKLNPDEWAAAAKSDIELDTLRRVQNYIIWDNKTPLSRETLGEMLRLWVRAHSNKRYHSPFEIEPVKLIPALAAAYRDCCLIQASTIEDRSSEGEGNAGRQLLTIRRAFFSSRVLLREFRKGIASQQESISGELKSTVLGFRALRRVFSQIREDLKFEESLSWPKEFGISESGLRRLLRRIESGVKSESIAEEPHPESVLVSEFLDARSLHNKVVFVLGLTEDRFPLDDGQSDQLSSDEENFSFKIARSRGKQSSTFESFYILAHLLKNARAAIFSFSQESVDGDKLPAGFLHELAGYLTEQGGAKLSVITEPVKAQLGDKESDYPPSERLLALFRSRAGKSFDSYDGLVGPGELSAKLSSDGTNSYSVTSVETLAKCPHKFFFAEVLGLHPLEPLSERVAAHVGTMVHKILERLFCGAEYCNVLVTEENFSAVCARALEIAEEEFSNSHLSWDETYELRQAKRQIIRGLDTPRDAETDSVRRGYLKAAIAFEKDAVQSGLASIRREGEIPFGRKEGPLEIENGAHLALLSGKIDRIDHYTLKGEETEGSRLRVWDYKTGQGSQLIDLTKGKSLQLPLYAQYVAQAITPGKLPHGGGYIILKNPNIREFPSSINEHPVRELLAVARKRAIVRDPEAVPERVDFAVQKMREFDSLVREGKFQQRLDTEEVFCEQCKFNGICSRNEALLERKSEQLETNTTSGVSDSDNLSERRSLLRAVDSNSYSLSPEQKAAIDIRLSLSLKAGAGSGKTSVLVARVLRMILSGVTLDSILAITYTEKAAAEIKERIGLGISGALKRNSFEDRELSPEERSALVEARCLLREAQFSTIHSLSSRIVKMDRRLSGLLDFERIVEGGERAVLFQESLDEVLNDRTNPEVSARINRLFDNRLFAESIKEGVLKLVDAPFKMERLISSYAAGNQVGEGEFAELIALVREVYQRRTAEKISALQSGIAAWLRDAKHWFSEALTKGTPKKPFLTEIKAEYFRDLFPRVELILESSSESPKERISKLEELSAYLQEHSSDAQKSARVGSNPRNFWKELREYLKDELNKIGDFTPEVELEGLRVGEGIIFLANLTARRFAEKKRKLGVADFNDLIYSAYNMLTGADPFGQKENLRKRLRARFKHVMVDEFQDTDAIQWEVVKAVSAYFATPESTTEDPSATDATAEKSSIVIVGDNQQAIYGFRGGDIRVFKQATAEILSRGGKELTLSDNYRSASPIVEFNNELFGKLFNADFSLEGRALIDTAVRPQEMHATRQVDGDPRVLKLKIENLGKRSEATAVESLVVAKTIRGIVEEVQKGAGVTGLEALTGQKKYPVVAVLTRKVNHLLLMAKALELEGVPYSISHSNGFYDLEEILQFENLLKWLNDPRDEVAFYGVLRSALIGLTDRELVKYRLARHNASGTTNFAELDGKLAELRRELPFNTVSKFLGRVTSILNLESSYRAAGLSERYRNIERLIDALAKAEFSGEMTGEINGSVSGAVSWISRQRMASSRPPSANNSTDPVVLMTIHGSKGLEFPLVVLPFLEWPPTKTDRTVVEPLQMEGTEGDDGMLWALGVSVHEEEGEKTRKTFLKVLIDETVKERSLPESRRLFYVACTRAIDYLVFPLVTGAKVVADEPEEEAGKEFEKEPEGEPEEGLECISGAEVQPDKKKKHKKKRNSSNPLEWLRSANLPANSLKIFN